MELQKIEEVKQKKLNAYKARKMQEYANQIKSKEVQDYHVDHAHKVKTESDGLFTIVEMDREKQLRDKKD